MVTDESRLPRSVSFLHWKLDGRYDEARMQHTLRTIDGNVTLFDVTTGSIAAGSRPGTGG